MASKENNTNEEHTAETFQINGEEIQNGESILS